MTTTTPVLTPEPAPDPARTDPDPDRKPQPSRTSRAGSRWFRAFWRWHFYASFLVIPVLLVLASTGLVYLLRFQIEPLLHADLMKVDPPQGASALPYDAQRAAVAEAYPNGRIAAMTEPSGPDRSTDFSVSTAPPGTPSWADDSIVEVYVNPYTGEVMGSLDPDRTVSGIAKNLHKNLLAGDRGGYLMELGACWALVMAITGYYLFWRGRAARARRRAKAVAGAALRHQHATVGALVGVGLLALVVTGLPWTQGWGAKVQELATERGTSLWSSDPGAQSSAPTLDTSMPHSHAVPWGQGKQSLPQSSSPTDTASGRPITVDAAISAGEAADLQHPMTVALPADETGVYSVMGYAFNDPSGEKTVHVDQFTGNPAATYAYDDYPEVAKVVSQGIALHEGRRFGTLNFWASALFCLAVMSMCVTGPLMWWRRRPKKTASLGAPMGRMPVATNSALALILVILGVFLPLFGLSLLAVLLLDQVVLRRIRPVGSWFNVS